LLSQYEKKTFLKGNKNDFDGSNNIFANCKVYPKQGLGSIKFYPEYSDYLDTDPFKKFMIPIVKAENSSTTLGIIGFRIMGGILLKLQFY
jgi:hypothetical protein